MFDGLTAASKNNIRNHHRSWYSQRRSSRQHNKAAQCSMRRWYRHHVGIGRKASSQLFEGVFQSEIPRVGRRGRGVEGEEGKCGRPEYSIHIVLRNCTLFSSVRRFWMVSLVVSLVFNFLFVIRAASCRNWLSVLRNRLSGDIDCNWLWVVYFSVKVI
jgi:hypothetical protein